MDILQNDLFPAELKQAATILFERSALAVTLLEQPAVDEVPICLPPSFAHESTLLHPQEILKFASYRLAKRRAEFLTGRICAKLAIKSFLDSGNLNPPPPLDKIEIANDPFGRPIINLHDLTDWLPPEISITHGGKYAAALATDSPCGIDVQQQRDNLLRVREKYCSLSELQLLGKILPNLTTLSCLAMLWTAKEAAKKALSSLQMPGFLELELMQLANDSPNCYSLTMAVMVRDNSRMPQIVRVLATPFADYGLAICILTPTHEMPFSKAPLSS
ncbi:MAG: 4'-phosphopantetheinyl transferase superfamily protein [Pseudomonadota bacterium]